MNTKLVGTSKFLSLVLRHRPEIIGLQLDANGWVPVADLLSRAGAERPGLDRAQLEEIVATNPKNRFELDRETDRIRARQGHSVEIELDLPPVEPPPELYHGTAERVLAAILAGGLRKGKRHHVHLTAELATARDVGGRHGRPVVLVVASGVMHRAGHAFYRTGNGVWLTDHVAPAHLRLLSSDSGLSQ